jgi:hypothetical protein
MGPKETKYKRVKMWFKCLLNPPQILLLQKHHLDIVECKNFVVNLKFKGGTVLWNLGIHMETTHKTMKAWPY